jgi:hypothetical protein
MRNWIIFLIISGLIILGCMTFTTRSQLEVDIISASSLDSTLYLTIQWIDLSNGKYSVRYRLNSKNFGREISGKIECIYKKLPNEAILSLSAEDIL